jgi:hypothetical protein
MSLMSDITRIIMIMDVDQSQCDPNEVEELVDMWSEILQSELDDGTDLQELCLSMSRALKAVLNDASGDGVVLH